MKNQTMALAKNQHHLMINAGICLLITGIISFFCTSSVFAKTAASAQVDQKIGQNISQNISHNISQIEDGNQSIDDKVISSHQKTDQQIDANAISNTPVAFERGGLDKASEHLQILQQTTPHFVDTFQARKPASVDKKLQSKPQSNS